jgi:hypothetical protein
MSLLDAASPAPPSAQPSSPQSEAPPAASPPSGQAAPAAGAVPGAVPGADPLTTPQPGKEAIGGNGGPDWRAVLAGEDADAIKDLARYQSPADLMKAFKEQRAALSRRAEPVKLPDNPTPQQLADYRKAQGVPDLAKDAPVDDVLKAYGVSPPEGYTMTDATKGMMGDFIKEMNAANIPPAAAKKATEFYFKQDAAMQQAVRKDNSNKAKEWGNGLRDELGSKEYEAQQAAATKWMREQFKDAPDDLANILNAQLPGGGVLGDHPWLFKTIAGVAMGAGYTDRIEANALESNGKSLLDQRAEIEKLILTDRARYDALQPRLQQINRSLRARGDIDGNGDPVRRRA